MKKINCHLVNASICLSDIDCSKIKKASNGKIYLNFVINTRKETDQFGNDLNLSYTKTKEEKEAKIETVYVPGNAKSVTFDSPASPDFTDEPVQADELNTLWINDEKL